MSGFFREGAWNAPAMSSTNRPISTAAPFGGGVPLLWNLNCPTTSFMGAHAVAAVDLRPHLRVVAAAVWSRVVAGVPTLLGKLVTVSSCRLNESVEYHHPALEGILPAGEASGIIRECHERIFSEWLGLFPEEQLKELDDYLSSVPHEDARWLLFEAREGLVPPTVAEVVRKTFLTDFETMFLM